MTIVSIVSIVRKGREGKHDPRHRPFSAIVVYFKGMRYINGYDDVEIVAGAGTMGMEILEQVGLGGGVYSSRIVGFLGRM